jgi:3-oxoacyl-[acyl-carrier-protein] synthase-3
MYVPDFILDNNMFNQTIETNDEWIVSHTGIKERRIEQEKYNYEMIGEACKTALQNASLTAEQIDMIIVSTITPDYNYPSTACLTQNYIGAVNAASFDVSAACSGFVFVLDVADMYIKSGRAKNILIASGDVLTRTADYFDRSNCILFGDGAGAAVVSAREIYSPNEKSGILSSFIKCDTDGNKPYAVYLPLYEPCEIFDKETKAFKGNIEKIRNSYIKQNGREVYQFVARKLPVMLDEATARAGVTVADLDYIILHQANKRILDYVIEKYKLDPEKVPINISKYGNTSSATVPILLHELNMENKFKKGDLIALAGFGSGLAYGSAVIKW